MLHPPRPIRAVPAGAAAKSGATEKGKKDQKDSQQVPQVVAGMSFLFGDPFGSKEEAQSAPAQAAQGQGPRGVTVGAAGDDGVKGVEADGSSSKAAQGFFGG